MKGRGLVLLVLLLMLAAGEGKEWIHFVTVRDRSKSQRGMCSNHIVNISGPVLFALKRSKANREVMLLLS